MLAGYDFGAFVIEVRRATGWTQQALAGVVGLTQSQISSIERGERRLRDIELIAGLARALAIPPALLNFPDIGATVGATGVTRLKDVSWVDRRDFGQHIAGLVLGRDRAGHRPPVRAGQRAVRARRGKLHQQAERRGLARRCTAVGASPRAYGWHRSRATELDLRRAAAEGGRFGGASVDRTSGRW